MINTKRLIPLATVLIISTVAVFSCAREPKAGTNDASKRYFDAWISTHHPDLKPTDMGEYIIEDKAGTGEELFDNDSISYLFVKYTVTDLDGNVTSSTIASVQQQLGNYSKANYYGPVIWDREETGIPAGEPGRQAAGAEAAGRRHHHRMRRHCPAYCRPLPAIGPGTCCD